MHGSRIITVTGGNLWAIAAREFGDATVAARIAKLNGLTDPFLVGTVTLRLPPVDATPSDGLPQA